MVGELFHLLFTPQLHKQVSSFDCMGCICVQKMYVHTDLSKKYWLDNHKCYKYRHKNSSHLFELFASFNDEDLVQVRKDTIAHISRERNFYRDVGYDHLKRLKMDIDKWLCLMSSESVFGDELMIYALSRMYHRHTVVFHIKVLLDDNRLQMRH